jgi:hypothetical protein
MAHFRAKQSACVEGQRDMLTKPYRNAGCYLEPQATVKNERTNLIHFNCHATNWGELPCRYNGVSQSENRVGSSFGKEATESRTGRVMSNLMHATQNYKLQPARSLWHATQNGKRLHVTQNRDEIGKWGSPTNICCLHSIKLKDKPCRSSSG